MPAFIDKNPVSGVEMWVDQNEDEETRIHYRQDVEPILEHNKALRNVNGTDHMIKKDLWEYANIPPVVMMKMMYEDKIDPFKRENLGKVFDLINTKYPYCKTTNLTHRVSDND
jgi:hypothetical protein